MKINYEQIGSILKSKETDELKKSVASDLQQPDKPLSMLEFAKMKDLGQKGIDWGEKEETEEELRQREKEELEMLDRMLDLGEL